MMNAHTPHRDVGHAGASSVIELLISHLMDRARERTIRQTFIGARFCGIMLDDGATARFSDRRWNGTGQSTRARC